MYKIFGVFLFIFLSVSCISKSSTESNYNPVYNNKDIDKLIIPFKAMAYKADYHVMAYFDGHDVYESVEAFIFNKDDSYIFQAIMTDHNNRQVDYVSSDTLKIKGNDNTKISRKTYKTTGKFNLLNNGMDYTFSFKLEDNSIVSIYYKGFVEPNIQNGGMTDPEGHSPDVGIPMMLRSSSGIGSKESYVEINNNRYSITIDHEISVEPFFTGYKSYLTSEFFFALIPSHITEETILHNQTINKEYTTKTPHGYNKISLLDNNEILNIKHFSSISSDSNSYMEISFSPALPNIAALINNQEIIVTFNISYSNYHKNQVYGKIKIVKDQQGQIKMELIPEYPLWAKENRKMHYDILLVEEKVIIEAYNI